VKHSEGEKSNGRKKRKEEKEKQGKENVVLAHLPCRTWLKAFSPFPRFCDHEAVWQNLNNPNCKTMLMGDLIWF
jgi:hypothetical protein